MIASRHDNTSKSDLWMDLFGNQTPSQVGATPYPTLRLHSGACCLLPYSLPLKHPYREFLADIARGFLGLRLD